MMSVYYYIAELSPEKALEVCDRNGFSNIYNQDELANTLQVIAASGEDGLKQVMEIHPEKEVILEIFEKKCPSKNFIETQPKKVFNADGKSKIVTQTNAFILVGAIIISLAVISAKN